MNALKCHIVLPVYRDVESFLLLRDRLCEVASELDVHFWVVDDTAGHDAEIAALVGLDDVTVIRPPFNLGHQRAIVLGLRVARRNFAADDVVVTMDSDGEDRPEDLPLLLEALRVDPDRWRVVVAKRTKRKESLFFKTLYLGFRGLFRTLTGTQVRSGNYACFRGGFAHRLLSHPSFDLCYSSSLLTLTTPVMVPCPRGDRYAGSSRMGVEGLLMHGIRMLMPFADRIAIRSLALCVIAAAATVMAGLAIGVAHLTNATTLTPADLGWVLVLGVAVAGIGFVNFLVLFAGYAQTSALALSRVEDHVEIT